MFKNYQKGSAKWIWLVVILVIIVGAAIALRSQKPADTLEEESGEVMEEEEADSSANSDSSVSENTPDEEVSEDVSQDDTEEVVDDHSHEVSYTDSGFSPSTETVALGETVTFVNNSSGDMWVASAMHPTHEVYSGTSRTEHCPDPEGDDFDACERVAPGGSWSFTFNQAGEWRYHNHVQASHTGSVVVE